MPCYLIALAAATPCLLWASHLKPRFAGTGRSATAIVQRASTKSNQHFLLRDLARGTLIPMRGFINLQTIPAGASAT